MTSKFKLFAILSIIGLFLFVHTTTKAQWSAVTLGGGSSFGSVPDNDADLSGFRVVGGYETMVWESHWVMGASLSYMKLEGDLSPGTTTKFISAPGLFVPKFTLGNGNLKAYAKGAAGLHYTRIQYFGLLLGVKDWNIGLALGTGAGFSYAMANKILIFADYEFLWLNNNDFSKVQSNTVGLGIGYIF